MTPTLDPQTADVITFWIALAVAMGFLALLLALIALARVSRLRRDVAQPPFGTTVTHHVSGAAPSFTSARTMMSASSSVVDPSSVSPRVRQLVAAGKKIEAIKLVREETGLGLREAKDLVERL